MSGVNDANLQLLAKIRGQLVDRLQPEGLLGLDGHILVALRFHRLVRLTKVRKKEGDGAAWEAFFAAHVPNLAAHGRTLWADWRTKLIKDDTPGTLVAIGEGDPRSHGNVYEGKVFVNLESVADDYIAAVDSVMAACGKDEDLARTLVTKWRATQWTVQWLKRDGHPKSSARPTTRTPATALYVPQAVSASASSTVVRTTNTP